MRENHVAPVWRGAIAARLNGDETFIITEMAEEKAYSYGFSYATRSFDDALQKAFNELGKDARIVVNAPFLGTPLPPQNRVNLKAGELVS